MWGQLLFRRKCRERITDGGRAYRFIFTSKLQDYFSFVKMQGLFLHLKTVPFGLKETLPTAAEDHGPCGQRHFRGGPPGFTS